MKKDIDNRLDIELLVNAFYNEVKNDTLLYPFFVGLNAVQWQKHLERQYLFWENALFYKGGYLGNPLQKHRLIHQQMKIEEKHFKRWVYLFFSVTDSLFAGQMAELVKQRAYNIAVVLKLKLHDGITDYKN